MAIALTARISKHSGTPTHRQATSPPLLPTWRLDMMNARQRTTPSFGSGQRRVANACILDAATTTRRVVLR